jgi:UDP-N-acetylmuramyl pentapeptide phosphotransferase/UDP-N-acetylglucosamine-1-phosphate transferase
MLGVVLVVFSFCASLALTQWLCKTDSRFHLLDHPNERSLHTRPTPRTGGLAMVMAIVVSWGVATYMDGGSRAMTLLLAALIVAGISLLDDYFSVSTGLRFGVHLSAGAMMVWSGFGLPDGIFAEFGWEIGGTVGAVLAVLYIVWMLNLYNFMDGMDGFAGGMAVFGFGGLALAGLLSGRADFAIANGTIAAAAGGFLVFNFPPARIFMGDVGSSFLGTLAAGSSLWGANSGVLPFWVALLLFSPFIVDATFTLIRRAFRGERVWEAHRTHIYQRLVCAGWGHRKTVLGEYVLMSACLGTALLVMGPASPWRAPVFVVWCVIYAVALVAATRLKECPQGRGGPSIANTGPQTKKLDPR